LETAVPSLGYDDEEEAETETANENTTLEFEKGGDFGIAGARRNDSPARSTFDGTVKKVTSEQ
jgi:hypothetical protein